MHPSTAATSMRHLRPPGRGRGRFQLLGMFRDLDDALAALDDDTDHDATAASPTRAA